MIEQWLTELDYWAWWIAGVVLVILEIVIPGAVFLWMGIAAGVVGLLVLLVPDLDWHYQFLIFAALSVISIAAARRYLKRSPIETDHPTLNRRGEQYVGRTLTLAEPIVNGNGKAHIDDTMWKLSGPDMPTGAQVRVTGVDGVVLQVEASQS